MPLPPERLSDIVGELATRPGHEKVRTLVYELLVGELGASSTEIEFERRLPEVRGRLDALLGNTVFEFKRDLTREQRDAEEELSRYLAQRERETGERFIGIATDGARFSPYELRDSSLVGLRPFQTSVDDPHSLVTWLDAAVSVRPDLPPDPITVQRELGRESLAYQRARALLEGCWSAARGHPDAEVKRKLWDDLLEKVYGARVGADQLFLQHTYLTIVAKTMAARVVDLEIADPADLLSGRRFQEAGITGAVESDFFDWILAAPGGPDVVARIARQTARFRLRAVEHDVLKGLYETLIDPEQRHDLGEYYTPDWLAARICEHTVAAPLTQRVLDPACGSGTFLFHSVRRFLSAADAAGLRGATVLSRCTELVFGIDVHPLAVLIARVTYLLALSEERLRSRPAQLSVPVYLGDALQWNTRQFLGEREVLIAVPDGPVLHFPAAIAADPGRFDATIETMLSYTERNAPRRAFEAWLNRETRIPSHERSTLAQTYDDLEGLYRAGRNHIWGYVARNLTRPLWLSSPSQRADIVLGNPPWLSYRFMTNEIRERFKSECQARGLWAGGKLATHQDLSAYFFARSVELYLKDIGVIAFVMPYAAMTRGQFRGFRLGDFHTVQVRFTEAWTLDENVQPLFPVPSCVLFARREPRGVLPPQVQAFRGSLPRRDATPAEATAALQSRITDWPTEATLQGRSPYRRAFRQGATMVPRRFCLVERAQVGRLGGNPTAPLVQGRVSTLDKPPWRDIAAPRGNVEVQFLRPLYLGEAVAPFRLLSPALAIIPWDEGSNRLLDGPDADEAGYPHLARWMTHAQEEWSAHGKGRMTLLERWNYQRGLQNQLPPAPLRVLYAASGTLPAAALLRDSTAFVEHKLYWSSVADENEGRFLLAILNSEFARKRIADRQSRGQWGARDFDKVMLELPIPRFDSGAELHQQLAVAAQDAEQMAAQVEIAEDMHFVRARRTIRRALQEAGISQRIEDLVAQVISDAPA